MLADSELDAVVIATPVPTHYALAKLSEHKIRAATDAMGVGWFALDDLLADLDADEPFPVRELGTPRGRQGSPRSKVALPDGWLDDTDGRGAHLREDANETTGG